MKDFCLNKDGLQGISDRFPHLTTLQAEKLLQVQSSVAQRAAGQKCNDNYVFEGSDSSSQRAADKSVCLISHYRPYGPNLPSINQCPRSPDLSEKKYHLPQAYAELLDNNSFHWNWYGHFTFRGYPHSETANKAWDKFIHLLNRECFGHYYYKNKSKGVTWSRGTEDQKRGAIHFHALIGNIPDRVDRMKYKEVWYKMAGICRIFPYEKNRGAEFYMSKSTYAWKKGEIDLSETMKYHAAEMVFPSGLR